MHASPTSRRAILLGALAGFCPLAAQTHGTATLLCKTLPAAETCACTLTIRPYQGGRPNDPVQAQPMLNLKAMNFTFDRDTGEVTKGEMTLRQEKAKLPLGPTLPELPPVSYGIAGSVNKGEPSLQFTQLNPGKDKVEATFTDGLRRKDGSVTGTVILDYRYVKNRSDFHWQETIPVVLNP